MAIGTSWVLGVFLGGIPAAEAQMPGGDRPLQSGESAEELIEAALEKVDTGDYEQAAALMGRARRIKPTLAKISLVEGLLLMKWREHRNYPEAVQKLEEYCASNEGRADYRGYTALGWIYKESRSYRQAIRPFEQAKRLAPNEEKGKPVRAQATIDLAFSYLGLNRRKDALEAAKEAASMAPDQPTIQLGYAQVAGDLQEYNAADTAARRAVDLLKAKIRRQPFDKDAHETLKQCHYLLMRVKVIALQTAPEDGALFAALASLWVDQADVDRRLALLAARELAIQALQKDPKQIDWQLLAARIEIDLGTAEEAKRRLEEARQAAPDNQEVLKLLDSLAPAVDEQPPAPQP